MGLQRSGAAPSPKPEAPPIVSEALRSPGQPLDQTTRDFLEPRFGTDCSEVRVHTGAQAAESARAVNALAYTVGKDVVFGAAQYSPENDSGRRLLAHELSHVVQQSNAEAPAEIQRKCGPRAMGPVPASCNLINVSASDAPRGSRFLFNVNCDEFAPGEREKLDALADPKITPPGSEIEVLGLASADGDPEFNKSLSCHRADAAVKILTAKGLGPGIRSVQAAGGVENTQHDLNFRAVDVLVKKCDDLPTISQEKDPLPPTPAYARQFVQGRDLPAKFKELTDRISKNAPALPKGVAGFTLPILPVLFPDLPVPLVNVTAEDIPDSDCKKCVVDGNLPRHQIVSFVAEQFIFKCDRFWLNQDHNRRQCPSSGTFGDKKQVRVVITPEARKKIADAEQEHFNDAQRSFDLTGSRYLANSLRLTSDRTHLRGKDQQDCATKVASFLDRLSGAPGVLAALGTT